jgi:hypothetical protein
MLTRMPRVDNQAIRHSLTACTVDVTRRHRL